MAKSRPANSFWILARFLAALAVLIIVQFALVQLAAWFGHRMAWSESVRQSAELAASSLPIFALALVVMVVRPQCAPLQPAQLANVPPPQLVAGALIVAPMAVMVASVQHWLAIYSPDPTMSESFIPTTTLLICTVILPALSEEVVFRGWIGDGLTRGFGVVGGMLITSILFAVIHVFPALIGATLILGLILHWIYRQTGSLLFAVVIHGLNNLLALLAVRGNDSAVPIRLALSAAAASACLLWVMSQSRQRRSASIVAWGATAVWLVAFSWDAVAWLSFPAPST